MARSLFPLPGDHTTRSWLAAGMFMFALLLVIAPAPYFDARTIDDVSVWWKPLKFCLALGIHFVTLALLAQLLTASQRTGFLMRGVVWSSVAAGLFEIIYITLQAARGRRSHFNYETDIENLMYALMGLGALLLVFAPLVMGLMLAARRDGKKSGLRFGATLGMIFGPILTIVFAGYMSTNGSHFVGAPGASDAGGAPLFGWSFKYADLRPAHFVATHMIQALPIIGYAGDRLAPNFARQVVLLAALMLGALSVWLFATALSGAPALGLFVPAG